MNHPADHQATLLRERLDRLASSVSAGSAMDAPALRAEPAATPPACCHQYDPGRSRERTRHRRRRNLAAWSER